MRCHGIHPQSDEVDTLIRNSTRRWPGTKLTKTTRSSWRSSQTAVDDVVFREAIGCQIHFIGLSCRGSDLQGRQAVVPHPRAKELSV
jgi:hypothetical protein